MKFSFYRFLRVVPEELRSTNKDDFESYMADAQRQYKDTCRVSLCKNFFKNEKILIHIRTELSTVTLSTNQKVV